MRKRERGILTVEASIVLTLMTLFVLFLFSFIRIYRAENMVSHATIQVADAMALESYLRENALNDRAADVVYLANRITGASTLSAGNFESLRSANIPTIAKEKFIAAISNSEANANKVLTNYGVKGGLSGIDMSTSTVDLDHDDVIVNVSYTLKMQFPIFGATELSVTKSAKAKTFGEILFELTVEPENSNMGSTTGSGNYQHGTTVQITANPNYGYKFVKWNDGNRDNPRNVSVTDAKKYVAVFEADSFGVTTLISPNGAGTASGAGTYKYLSTANLNAIANPGYHFDKWSVYKHKDFTTTFITTPNVSQKIDQSYTYTANFVPNTYTINVVTSGANGTVAVKSGANSGSSLTVEYGSTFDLVQTAPTGYIFKGWKINGGSSFISSTNGIAVPATYSNGSIIPNNATITYTAYYEKEKFNVIINSAGNGTIRVGNSAFGTSVNSVVEYGEMITVSVSPSSEYHFDHWNDTSFGSGSSISFTVKRPVNLTAYFKINQYTITVKSNNTSYGTAKIKNNGKDSIVANYGDSIQLEATPNAAYRFVKWTDNASSGALRTVTVKGNAVYYADFDTNSVNVILNANEGSINGKSQEKHDVVKGSNFNFSSYTPVRNGYTFAGWYCNGTKYEGNKAISSNITVTARWRCNHRLSNGATMLKPSSSVGVEGKCSGYSVTYVCTGTNCTDGDCCKYTEKKTGNGAHCYEAWCGTIHNYKNPSVYSCTSGSAHLWRQYGCITCKYCGEFENGRVDAFGNYRSEEFWCILHNGHLNRKIMCNRYEKGRHEIHLATG